MTQPIKLTIGNFIRALRLPFCSASVLPFIFGSIISWPVFNVSVFCLGLIGAVSMHLSANLINDYFDSLSMADWQDKTFYGFFGGSKLIQEGVLSEKFYLKLATVFAVVSFLSILFLFFILKSFLIIYFFLIILFFSWYYSIKPLQLVYHYLGEIIIFVLFGPALVMGGYFLQTGIFPDFKSFLLSLPFGLLTTAILYVNEIPDRLDDEKAGKFTWASFLKEGNSYLIYCVLIILAFVSIVLNVAYGFISSWALISFVSIFLVVKAIIVLKKWPNDKMQLVESSKLTITVQSFVSLILIMGIVL